MKEPSIPSAYRSLMGVDPGERGRELKADIRRCVEADLDQWIERKNNPPKTIGGYLGLVRNPGPAPIHDALPDDTE